MTLNDTRRRARRATTPRNTARVGGIRSRKPITSVMKPGASRKAPPTGAAHYDYEGTAHEVTDDRELEMGERRE